MTQADHNDPGEKRGEQGGRKTGRGGGVKSMRETGGDEDMRTWENGSWRSIYTDSERDTGPRAQIDSVGKQPPPETVVRFTYGRGREGIWPTAPLQPIAAQ